MKKRNTRNEIRKEIMETINKCKNSCSIETIYKIADIYKKASRDEECGDLTELQWQQMIIINSVMETNNVDRLRNTGRLLRAMNG